MTVKECSEKFGITPQHVRRLIRNGVLPASDTVSGWDIPDAVTLKDCSANISPKERPAKERKPPWETSPWIERTQVWSEYPPETVMSWDPFGDGK